MRRRVGWSSTPPSVLTANRRSVFSPVLALVARYKNHATGVLGPRRSARRHAVSGSSGPGNRRGGGPRPGPRKAGSRAGGRGDKGGACAGPSRRRGGGYGSGSPAGGES